MEAISPRSPSQPSSYERSYDQASYAHPSTYPSPPRTEGDTSSYMTDSMVLYNQYPSMTLPNHSVHPAQTLYPLSPHPTEAPWTPSLAPSASPAIASGQRGRVWTEPYEVMSWEQSFSYMPPGSLVDPRHSPALSDGVILSQRSSISSYDPSLYSQDDSDTTWIKAEPQNELMSDEDPMRAAQPLTVSPLRLGNSSETNTVNTSTARTRSRSTTTRENATHKCEICGRLFQRSYNHNAHMDIHNPQRPKPNVCKTKGCGRKFVRRTDLIRHDQSVHLKVKNHKCVACDAHFARKDTLRRHTEDGCPKRFDVITRQAQRQAAARGQRALPMHNNELPQHQATPQHMSSLGYSTPY